MTTRNFEIKESKFANFSEITIADESDLVNYDTTSAKVKSVNPAHLKSPTKDPEAAPESLMALVDKDDATNRLLARHPRASAELLEKLSHSSDKATRQAVTGNPNTPPQTFVRLGQQFPKVFLANPILDLLLLENPALIEDEVPIGLLIRLVKQTDCPQSLLYWAAGHVLERVQMAVSMNASASQQVLQRLRQSEHETVRGAVQSIGLFASNEQDPEGVFKQAVRERIGSLSPGDLKKAWSSRDIGLAQWNALPLTFRLVKSVGNGFSPAGIVRGLNQSGVMFETFMEICSGYLNDRVRRHVAGNSSTPAVALEAFSNLVFATLTRSAVARNPSTPPFVLEAFSKLRFDAVVPGEVAQNPATPVPVLELLSKNPASRVRSHVAQNPSTLEPTLVALSMDADCDVRRGVAENPSTPGKVLAILSEDSESRVRSAVAANVHTADPIKAQLLEDLSKSSESRVRCEVARNPTTPVPVLVVLSRDADDNVRSSVAANQSVPSHLLEALSKDSDKRVRENVAGNSMTPTSILEKLAADSSSDVRFALPSNPSTPLPVLLKLVRDKCVYVREALAAQAHRSEAIRKKLWADSSNSVRWSVASCASLDQTVLDEMVQEAKGESDLINLFGHPNLSVKSVKYISDKLLHAPATESAWYKRELTKASAEVRAAAQADAVLSYHGKDPNKAVLTKRAVGPLMALCAGLVIEPSRLVKVVGSTDWLVRAAVARNPGTPPNLMKKLSADAHPLVAALAKRSQLTDSAS